MKHVSIEEAEKTLKELVAYVNASKGAVVLSAPDGTAVRLVPFVKPLRYSNGRPVYHIDDLQHLSKEEFPLPPEPVDDED